MIRLHAYYIHAIAIAVLLCTYQQVQILHCSFKDVVERLHVIVVFSIQGPLDQCSVRLDLPNSVGQWLLSFQDHVEFGVL